MTYYINHQNKLLYYQSVDNSAFITMVLCRLGSESENKVVSHHH